MYYKKLKRKIFGEKNYFFVPNIAFPSLRHHLLRFYWNTQPFFRNKKSFITSRRFPSLDSEVS